MKKLVTIRRYGTPLVRQPNGVYLTEDGRYEVTSDDGYMTTCDNPHPVRGRKLGYGGVLSSHQGYYCEGNADHYYTRWHIWDWELDEYAFGDSPGAYETFGEAAQELTRELARQAAATEAPPAGREHAYKF